MSSIGRSATAEFIGTFGLVFFGVGSILTDQFTGGQLGTLGIALAHGTVLAVLIATAGRVSGGHFNPAVTGAFLVTGRVDLTRAAMYGLAQLLGAMAATLVLRGLFPAAAVAAARLGVTLPAGGTSPTVATLIEAVLTFFLVFAIWGAAVDPEAPRAMAGLMIGVVLIFEILVGAPFTGASMNPARSFGPALVMGVWQDHLVYWIGPLLGALAGAWTYEALRPEVRSKERLGFQSAASGS